MLKGDSWVDGHLRTRVRKSSISSSNIGVSSGAVDTVVDGSLNLGDIRKLDRGALVKIWQEATGLVLLTRPVHLVVAAVV